MEISTIGLYGIVDENLDKIYKWNEVDKTLYKC